MSDDVKEILAWAMGGGLVSLVGGWLAIRKFRVDAAKTINDMFSSLCEKQQATIEQLTARIAANEAEIAELRQELEESRWRERALQERVAKLEAENATLRQELEERRKQTAGR